MYATFGLVLMTVFADAKFSLVSVNQSAMMIYTSNERSFQTWIWRNNQPSLYCTGLGVHGVSSSPDYRNYETESVLQVSRLSRRYCTVPDVLLIFFWILLFFSAAVERHDH